MALRTPGWGCKAWPRLGCQRQHSRCGGVLEDFRPPLSSSEERARAQAFCRDLPVSDRIGHDRTGIGYKASSVVASRSLSLPSSSDALPVQLQSTSTSAQSRDICISEGEGRVGSSMAVLAGQTGTKFVKRV